MEKIELYVKECGFIKHGDHVEAMLASGDEDATDEFITGRIYINPETYLKSDSHFEFYICQDSYCGASCTDDPDERFGYAYSWVVAVDNEGNIISEDTECIRKIKTEEEPVKMFCNPCITELIPVAIINQDDDPMPENWIMTDIIPDNL